MDKEAITSEEAAKILEVSKTRIRVLVHEGKLRFAGYKHIKGRSGPPLLMVFRSDVERRRK